jgi:hypothetical protein
MARDTDGGEQTEGTSTGPATLGEFFAQHAETELGIPSDSPRPSSTTKSTTKMGTTPSPKREATRAAADDSDEEQPDDRDEELDDEAEDEDREDEGAEGESEDDESDDDAEGDEAEDTGETAGEDDDEFTAAAERHKLPTDFERVIQKLPKEARAEVRGLLTKELKAVHAGFTRMTQEGREYRQRERVYLANEMFRREHPEEAVVEMLLADPKLVAKVDARLAGITDDRTKSVESRYIENLRADVGKKAEAAAKTAEARQARGVAVEKLARSACSHYGIDFDLVEDALILAVTSSESKDISDDDVRRIVKAKAQKLKGTTILAKQEKKKDWVKEKIAASKQARTPLARAKKAQGQFPAPASRKPSGRNEDLTSQMMRTMKRIAPDMPRG